MIATLVAAQQNSEGPSGAAVGAHLIYYLGVVGLLGAVVIGAFVVVRAPRPVVRALPWMWILAAAGAIGLAEIGRADLDVSWSRYAGTPLGRAALIRGLALLVAYAGIALASAGRCDRAAFVLIGFGVVVSAFGHVSASHAASGSWAWLKEFEQAVHITAAGAWIGGLALLLVSLPDLPDRASSVRGFSTVATVAIAVVALTGVVRAWTEVGGWHRLFATGYGKLVIVKAVLLIGLAVLGGINRYRNVPEERFDAVRNSGVIELILAMAIFIATSFLSGTAPGRESRDVRVRAAIPTSARS